MIEREIDTLNYMICWFWSWFYEKELAEKDEALD